MALPLPFPYSKSFNASTPGGREERTCGRVVVGWTRLAVRLKPVTNAMETRFAFMRGHDNRSRAMDTIGGWQSSTCHVRDSRQTLWDLAIDAGSTAGFKSPLHLSALTRQLDQAQVPEARSAP